MRTSEATDQIAPALIAVQKVLTDPTKSRRVEVKNKQGTQTLYSYTYAPLPSFIEDVRSKLNEHDLAMLQGASADGTSWVTRLVHTSGQWVENGYPISRASDPKQQGSITTYARRYSLLAILGIVADDDDDGDAASPQTGGGSSLHHGSWADDAAAFCEELAKLDWPFDTIAAYCEHADWPRPEAMDNAKRRQTIRWLKGKGDEAVRKWDEEQRS